MIKIMLLSLMEFSTLCAMDESTPLRNSFNKVTVTVFYNAKSFDVAIPNSGTVFQLRKEIAAAQSIPMEKIILRSIHRQEGVVGSGPLADQTLIAALLSQFSNRFIIDTRS